MKSLNVRKLPGAGKVEPGRQLRGERCIEQGRVIVIDDDANVRAVLGDLEDFFGLPDGTAAYGLAVGDYDAGNYLLFEPSGGFKIFVGGKAVALGATGLTLAYGGNAENGIRFTNAAGTLAAWMQLYALVSYNALAAIVQGDAAHENASASLQAVSSSGASAAKLSLSASDAMGTEARLEAPTVTVTGGLNVGAAVGASAGQVDTGAGYKVAGNRVVRGQAADVVDTSGLATFWELEREINRVKEMLRWQGLMG